MSGHTTIRDPQLLGPLIGARCIEVTQHDPEEFDETGESRIYLHFDNGMTLSIPVTDWGFEIQDHPCPAEDDATDDLPPDPETPT